MSNYTPIVNYASKDTLISGNPLKLVKGAELSAEFSAIATAIASKFDGAVAFAPDGSAVQPSFGFTNNAGTGMYNVAGTLGFATNGLAQLTINPAGNVSVSAPSTGNSLAIVTAGGNVGVAVTAANPAIGFSATSWANTAANGALGITAAGITQITASAQLNLFSNGKGLTILTTGAVSIPVPTAATALVVNGAASNFTSQIVTTGLSAGTSFGLQVTAGTSSGDVTAQFRSQTGVQYAEVFGDGGVTIGTPTGGSNGVGTLNVATGLYIAGNQLFFGAPASASTTAAVTDVGKVINAAGTIIIPNAVFSQGHMVSIYNNTASPITITATITTMRLAGTATTGSRTLAARGLATIWFESGTECVVSGSGVT